MVIDIAHGNASHWPASSHTHRLRWNATLHCGEASWRASVLASRVNEADMSWARGRPKGSSCSFLAHSHTHAGGDARGPGWVRECVGLWASNSSTVLVAVLVAHFGLRERRSAFALLACYGATGESGGRVRVVVKRMLKSGSCAGQLLFFRFMCPDCHGSMDTHSVAVML